MKSLVLSLAIFILFVGTNAQTFSFPTLPTIYPGVFSPRIVVTVTLPNPSSVVRLTPKVENPDPTHPVTLLPGTLDFNANSLQQEFQVKVSSTDPVTISWTPNSPAFTTPPNITIVGAKINVAIDGLPSFIPVNLASSPIFIDTDVYPQSISLGPGSGPTGLNWNPATSQLDLTARAAEFSVTGAPESINYTTQAVSFQAISGGENYNFPVGASVTVIQREIDLIDFPSSIEVGVPYNFFITTKVPPGAQLGISASGASLTFSPSDAQFAVDGSTAMFTVIANSVFDSPTRTIHFTLTGAAASYYAAVPDQYITVTQHTFKISDLSSNIFLGQPFTLSVNLEFPPTQSVSLTLVGEGLQFAGAGNFGDDLTLTFTPLTVSLAFSVNASFTYTPLDTSFTSTIRFHVFGPNAADYAPPADLTVTTDKRQFYVSVPPSLTLTIGQPSDAIVVTIPQAPARDVTVTPKSDSGILLFNPPVLTFSSSATSISFTVTASDEGSPSISFEIGGADALVYQPIGSQSVNVQKGEFLFVNFPNVLKPTGTSGYAWISVNPPPASGVTVTPSAPGLTFSPATFTFTPFVSSLPFQVSSSANVPGDVFVYYAVSGTNADVYSVPSIAAISIAKGSINVPQISNLVIGNWSDVYTVSLSDRPFQNNGMTITPKGTGLVFEPPTLVFGAHDYSVNFRVRGTAAATVSVFWSFDSLAYYSPSIYQQDGLVVDLLSVYVPTSIGTYSGEESQIFTIILDHPPALSLNVTPTAAYTTFTPSTIVFDANTRTASFTATPNSPFVLQTPSAETGANKITWSLGGPSAGNYKTVALDDEARTPSPITLSLDSATGQTYVGIPARVLMTFPRRTTADLTIATDSDEISVASSIVIPIGTSRFTFAYTPLLVGPKKITFLLSGTDANNYVIQDWSDNAVRLSFYIDSIVEPISGVSQFPVGLASVAYAVVPQLSAGISVTITPSCPNITFSPASLSFSSTTPAATFTFTPTRVARAALITWAVTGANASLFQVPSPVTVALIHNFVFDPIPVQGMRTASASLKVGIQNPTSYPWESVTLIPKSNRATFNPPAITLTPAAPQATYTITPTRFTYTATINWFFKNLAEPDFGTAIRVPGNALHFRTFSVNASTFDMGYPVKLTLDQAIDCTFSVSRPPKNNVELTPRGTNIVFNPTTIVFTPTVTSVTVKVTAKIASTAATHNTPYTVDYIVGGADSSEYLTPAASILWVYSSTDSTIPTASTSTGGVTVTGTITATQSQTATKSVSQSVSQSASHTASQILTSPTGSYSESYTESFTESASQTATVTQSQTVTGSQTATFEPTVTGTDTNVPSQSEGARFSAVFLVLFALVAFFSL